MRWIYLSHLEGLVIGHTTDMCALNPWPQWNRGMLRRNKGGRTNSSTGLFSCRKDGDRRGDHGDNCNDPDHHRGLCPHETSKGKVKVVERPYGKQRGSRKGKAPPFASWTQLGTVTMYSRLAGVLYEGFTPQEACRTLRRGS
ncbi:hypothetical protein Dimus_013638 [Dionaea muscipula]